MTRNRSVYLSGVLAILVLVTLLAAGCRQSSFENGLNLYHQNKLEEALSHLEAGVLTDADNPDAYAYLAETYRRLGRYYEAESAARHALALTPCHSFAHTILANTYFPMYSGWEHTNADTTYYHLLVAVGCDSMDGNAWTGVWIEAMRRGIEQLEEKALRQFIKSGFLTPSLLAYNSWVLRSLPDKAILLTNGDMDTYPPLALQELEKLRPDVGIVNLSLLNLPWYARLVRDRYLIPLPFSDADLDSIRALRAEDGSVITPSRMIVIGWLEMVKERTFPRPLTVAVTVSNRNFTPDIGSRMRMDGPFFVYLAEPTAAPINASMVRASLADISSDDLRGPLVSPTDRSPVRRTSTNWIVKNVSALAVRYGYSLLQTGRPAEAHEYAVWAEEFERKTKAGPLLAEEIEKLKQAATEAMNP